MNESRQTVETDTLWLSNIRALNFRKPGHLRKYCNNENFPICGNYNSLQFIYILGSYPYIITVFIPFTIQLLHEYIVSSE